MYKRIFICISLCLLFIANNTIAQSQNPNIEPKANALLKAMGDCLKNAKEFSFEAYQISDYILDSGQKIQLSDYVKVIVKRPNQVYSDSTGDTRNERIWYNGTKLTVLNKTDNTYGIITVPNTIDKTLDYINSNFRTTLPIADLLVSDPYASAIANVESGVYLGKHYVGKVKCHHLAFRQDGLDWQIWIQDSKTLLPLQLAITFKELPSHPQFIAILKNWNLSPQIEEKTFVPQLPPNAKKVELLPKKKNVNTNKSAKCNKQNCKGCKDCKNKKNCSNKNRCGK